MTDTLLELGTRSSDSERRVRSRPDLTATVFLPEAGYWLRTLPSVGPHRTGTSPASLTTGFRRKQYRAQITSGPHAYPDNFFATKASLIGQAGLPSVFSSRAAGGPWARDPGGSLPVPALGSLTVVFCCLSCFAFWACSFLDFRNGSQAALLVEQGGASRKGRGERVPAPGAEAPLFPWMCWNLFQATFTLLRRRKRSASPGLHNL